MGQIQLGVRHTYVIVKENQNLFLFQDGKEILNYTGSSMPEALFDDAGALGLYAEDALVSITLFRVSTSLGGYAVPFCGCIELKDFDLYSELLEEMNEKVFSINGDGSNDGFECAGDRALAGSYQ